MHTAVELLDGPTATIASRWSSEPAPWRRSARDDNVALKGRVSAAAGFTLVEILLVASLIALLAAIAVPGYFQVMEKNRVTQAISDISSFATELKVRGIFDRCYPDTLADMGLGERLDPWGSPYVYGVLATSGEKGAPDTCSACRGTCLGKNDARKDHNLHPLNSDFDLYSIGKDHQSNKPLTSGASRDDIVRASDGSFIGLGRDY